MLNGWNSTVRTTSAISSACTTTLMVSPMPPSWALEVAFLLFKPRGSLMGSLIVGRLRARRGASPLKVRSYSDCAPQREVRRARPIAAPFAADVGRLYFQGRKPSIPAGAGCDCATEKDHAMSQADVAFLGSIPGL